MVYSNVAIAFVLLLIGSVVAGLARSWRSSGWVAAVFIGAAAAFAWVDGLYVLLSGRAIHAFIVRLPGFGSELAVSLDPLGAGFLLLITGVSLVGAVYSIGYMGIYRRESPGKFYLLLQIFIAGMIGVVSVSDWLFFIVFWELMTLASYFLVTFDRSNPAVVRAGFKYFVMTHIATAGLLLTAVVLWRATGSFSFEMHRSGLAVMSYGFRNLLLALYFIAFATKAGIFPMGDWLPDAYPAAPSAVSAIMSGVMSKLGAYGVLRIFWGVLPGTSTQTEVLSWGAVIVLLGTLSAFLGGVTAMKENDAKRLLAFSSMSQAGYIFLAMGIGVAFSRSPQFAAIALLGFLGAGFHILNDAIYKSLLFMNAGSIVYSAGTRDLNKVGGLSAVMPVVAAAGLVGVLSLSGLPPTNGFASKWIIYQSTIAGGIEFAPFIVAAVVASFVSLSTLAYSLKFYGTAFLGKQATVDPEPKPLPHTMNVSQGLLALICLVIGLSPFWAVGIISSVFGKSLSSTFGLGRTGALSVGAVGGAIPAFWSPVVLFSALVVCFVIAELVRASGEAKTRRVPSWYCGEEHLDDEIRFRARGFYSPFNEIFAKVYPHIPVPRLPSLKRLRSLLDLDRWVYDPVLRGGGTAVDKVSRSHVGTPQLYMVWQVGGVIAVLVLLFVLVR